MILYSHAKGDILLKTIAERLEKSLKLSNYFVYREHSDEFAILSDLQIREEFIQTVRDALKIVTKEPVKLGDKDIFIDFRYVFSFEDKDYLLQSANMMKNLHKINKYEIVYKKFRELISL